MINSSNDQPPTFKLRDAAALAFIVVLVLLFFWRIITPRIEDRAVFPPGDFTDQFWAFRMYEARAFTEGRLPLWSENFNSGHPFLADVQSAIFYPISLLWTLAVVALRGANFTLLDLEIEAIFHFILAGVFTYLFAKRLLGSRIAALASAITFVFSGYLTSYPPQQLAILETATWLPLALLFLELAIDADVIARSAATKQSPNRNPGIAASRSFDSATKNVAPLRTLLAMAQEARYYFAAGLTLGVAALAGHPQTFLFVVYTSAIYFAWRTIQQRNTEHASRIAYCVLRFGVALLVAAGITAAQWIPTLEYQTVSTRAAISWAEAASGFPTLDPLQMILPGFVSAFQSPLYIGILPLWLALFGFFVNRSREKTFWGALALGSLLVSFGFYVFAYALLYLFAPGFAMFRGQERLALVISFSLALLAGYGLRDLIQPSLDPKGARRALRAWALLPAGVTISMLMVLTLYISGTLRQSGRVAFLGDRAALMALLFGLATGLVAWRIRSGDQSPALQGARPMNRAAFAVLGIALVAFDLFSINNPAYNAAPQERYPVTPIVQAIQNDRGIFRVADEGRTPGHFGIAYNLEEIGGISPLQIAHYATLLDSLPPEKLWALLNVRYVITRRPGFADADGVMADGETRLLRLKNVLPRAWFVPYAIHNPNDREVLDALSSDAFDPWYVAYVAAVPASPLLAPPIRREQNQSAPAAEFLRITPEHARVIVNAPADGLLVLSENYYYPGWRAVVDGVPTPILRANVALSAVPVHAGAKQVEFVFDPWSVKVGLAVTVITLLCVVGGMLLLRARRVRNRFTP